MSSILWSLVVDNLLTELNQEGVYAQGYADDITILVCGKFEETVSDLTQQTLKINQGGVEGTSNPSDKNMSNGVRQKKKPSAAKGTETAKTR